MAFNNDISQMTNIARMAKETFWLDHKHLSADERERLWSSHTNELSSVLRPVAPRETIDLDARRQPTSTSPYSYTSGSGMNWNDCGPAVCSP